MKKCGYAKRYLGRFKPKCNKGKGCDACNLKYANKHPSETVTYSASVSRRPGIDWSSASAALGDVVTLQGKTYRHLATISAGHKLTAAEVLEMMERATKPKLREYTSAERKAMPLQDILASYFPDAFMALARHSKKANDKHNPGEPMHWAREKSTDHLNCAARHLLTPDAIDPDTLEIELVGAFWRCGAALQLREEKRLVALGIRPLSGVIPGGSG